MCRELFEDVLKSPRYVKAGGELVWGITENTMNVNVNQKRANNDVTVGVKDTDDLYPWSIQPTGERGRFCVYNFQRGYERYFSGSWDECEQYARAKRNAGAEQ